MFVSLGAWLGSERRCRPTVSAQVSGLSGPGVRARAGDIVLCSWDRHKFFLITMKFLGAFRKSNALTKPHPDQLCKL